MDIQEGFTQKIYQYIGGAGEGFLSVLITLAILVIGIMVAKTVSRWVTKALRSSEKLKSLGQGGNPDAVPKSVGQLAYYFVLLNVLLIVLERLGVSSVLDPLQQLVGQFTGALPKIIGASIIFYAGWVIAKLVAGVVEIAAGRLDAEIERRGFPMEFKTSKFLSAFVLGSILLPITIAGFEFLSIDAISVPAVAMISQFLSAVPKIVGAGLILLVAYVVGKFVVYMLTGLLDGMHVDDLPKKMGFENLMPNQMMFKDVIGSTVMFFIMLTATTAAIDKLQIAMVADVFAKILSFGGGIVLGSVILMAGTFIANMAYAKLMASDSSKSLAPICRIAILGLVTAMGLKSMGLAENIVTMAFAFTFGAVALASAIAFGVGGRDAARELTLRWSGKERGATVPTGSSTSYNAKDI